MEEESSFFDYYKKHIGLAVVAVLISIGIIAFIITFGWINEIKLKKTVNNKAQLLFIPSTFVWINFFFILFFLRLNNSILYPIFS